ncbi:hypothetical protein B0H14DRAFT_2626030 [Mycena olivaceomarginata]|nr:hypothetical protein B0H14DRAFT_2626030 [Mycena olivaceomarginata]
MAPLQYGKSTIELVVDSNFHSHLPKCSGMPEGVTFKVFSAAEAAEKAGTRPVPIASTSNLVVQRQTMTNFVQAGIENPAVTLTKCGFRERLIKAIALDDLAFSFPTTITGGMMYHCLSRETTNDTSTSLSQRHP